MRAALLYGFGDLRVEEVPDPVPAPDEVIVDVSCVQPSVTECALIAGELQHHRERSPVFLIPVEHAELMQTMYKWGARK